MKEKPGAIYLKENILDYDNQRPTQTYFEGWTWVISVPGGTYIKCLGGSGDFEVSGFEPELCRGIDQSNRFDNYREQ